MTERAWEARLAELHRAGEFHALVNLILCKYGADVRSFIDGSVRHRATAEECYSAFMEDIWRGVPKLRFQGTVRSWLFAVARNALCRQGRKHTRWLQHHVTCEHEQLQQLAQVANGEPTLILHLQPLLGQLSHADRALLKERAMHSLSWKEIAMARMSESQRSDTALLDRESARLRKRYQLLTHRLRKQLLDPTGTTGG